MNYNQHYNMEKTTEKPRKGYGVIYIITCFASLKSYVGQANNYISGNKPWGLEGRWKSHVYEAYGNKRNKCLLLNRAIRKYGKEYFVYKTLCEVPQEELDEKETLWIKRFNTFKPNGYNMTPGGQNFKITDEIRLKQSLAKKGKHRPRESVEKSRLGSIGLIKFTPRKREEDNDLPKYIIAKRKNNNIIGYSVIFPIGIEKRENTNKSFSNKNNPQEALQRAEAYLETLKEKYKNRREELEKRQRERARKN